MAITITEQTYSGVKKIDFAWTALTTGTTSGTTLKSYDGEILNIFASNTLTAAGTIKLLDEDSYDILMGAGTLTTGLSYLGTTGRFHIGAVAESTLTLEHTVSTTGGTGHVIVCIR